MKYIAAGILSLMVLSPSLARAKDEAPLPPAQMENVREITNLLPFFDAHNEARYFQLRGIKDQRADRSATFYARRSTTLKHLKEGDAKNLLGDVDRLFSSYNQDFDEETANRLVSAIVSLTHIDALDSSRRVVRVVFDKTSAGSLASTSISCEPKFDRSLQRIGIFCSASIRLDLRDWLERAKGANRATAGIDFVAWLQAVLYHEFVHIATHDEAIAVVSQQLGFDSSRSLTTPKEIWDAQQLALRVCNLTHALMEMSGSSALNEAFTQLMVGHSLPLLGISLEHTESGIVGEQVDLPTINVAAAHFAAQFIRDRYYLPYGRFDEGMTTLQRMVAIAAEDWPEPMPSTLEALIEQRRPQLRKLVQLMIDTTGIFKK